MSQLNNMIRKNHNLLSLISSLAEKSEAITLRNYEPGQRIIQQDQECHSVYIIKCGVAKCLITEDNDKDYILEFLGEGEIVGEIEAIKNQRATCSIQAITTASTYTMSNAQFNHLLKTMPEFNSIIVELLATRVYNSSVKSARQQLHTQAQILPQLLKALNAQQITFTKQDLAEYMGIEVRSLNRLLKQGGDQIPLSEI